MVGADAEFGVLMSRIGVAVVSHNTCALLRACLASAQADGAAEIVVVDTGSADDSVAMVRAEFPGATLLEAPGNVGYGAAANLALSRCTAGFVLLLNADTVLHPGALAALAHHLACHPEVAIVGPRLLNPDGTLQPSCFPFPGTAGWLVENDPLVRLAGLLPPLRRRLLHFSPPTVATRVPWVLGAALAIRRQAFEQVGGFDPAFFMYFEEVDLCRRLRDAGWEIHHQPAARSTHVGGASTRQVQARMRVAHHRSALRYYRRHTRGARLAFWLGATRAKLLARIGRDGVALLVRPGERPVLRERLSAWRAALREP